MTYSEDESSVSEEAPNGSEKRESNMLRVPENEPRITAARASGPGGQNVNKVNSKAVLHWNVGESAAFTDEQKDLIRTAAANNLNSEDEIVLSERQSRSWHQNRERVMERLQKKVAKALRPKKTRLKTSKPKSADERRLREKREQAEKKQHRQSPNKEDS